MDTIEIGLSQPLGARISRGQAVAAELERMIGTGYEPGQRVGTKDELRDRFRVAVATMNEAIRLLEARGIVETRPGPGGGVFAGGAATRLAFSHLVLAFSSGSVAYAECLEIRDTLEPVICEHAVKNHRAADVRALKQILKRMTGTDPKAYFDANWALHRRIAALCENMPLRSIYLAMLDFLEQCVSRAEVGKFDFAGFARVHQELVDAIDAGEARRLERAVARHRPTQALIAAAGQSRPASRRVGRG
jgi:DNA-binding FadR family transcriptional regulator